MVNLASLGTSEGGTPKHNINGHVMGLHSVSDKHLNSEKQIICYQFTIIKREREIGEFIV